MNAWMKICTAALMRFTSASTLVVRTSVNVNRTCTLLMANAEVITNYYNDFKLSVETKSGFASLRTLWLA